MDRVYVDCCGAFSAAFLNWNEQFQLALELSDDTAEQVEARQAELYRVETAFEAAAVQGAMRIVSMDSDAPSAVSKQPLCYCEGNIFYRVLPDSRAGRNIVASYRGILQSRTSLLTVPLTSLFIYRGTPVLAQALAPLGKEPQKRYGSDLVEQSGEIAAEVEMIADAINTPLPDYIVCEVYEGLDGRLYATGTNVSTIALDDSTLIDGPLKRPEMLMLCPCITATSDDTLNVLRNPSVMAALAQVCHIPADRQGQLLSDTLHFYGVNLCLMRNVMEVFRSYGGAAPDDVELFLQAVANEMMARTIKHEFYVEVQAKRLGVDDIAMGKCFGQHLRDAFDVASVDAFLSAVQRKYGLPATVVLEGGNHPTPPPHPNENGAMMPSEDESFISFLHRARRDHRTTIVERVSWLVGARASMRSSTDSSAKRKLTWVSLVAGRVVPRLCTPKMMKLLDPLYRSVQTNDAHRLAFCCPLQSSVAAWEGRMGDALSIASDTVDEVVQRFGDASLRSVKAKRFFMRLLFAVPSLENIREGCSLIAPILEVYQDRASPVSMAKCHIEVGCCLLSVLSIVDMAQEAALHFQAAEKLLTPSMRSSWGSWLFVQPPLGLLRCRQLGKIQLQRPLAAFASDALYLAKVVAPSDYVVEYLWELGMELGSEQQYAEAAQLLTAAYRMARRTPQSNLDLAALRRDVFNVYRTWDPERYAAYVSALEKS